MGACDFTSFAKKTDDIDTPEKAFQALVAQAKYDLGHAGYTGTIAEKGSDGFGMYTHVPVTMKQAYEKQQENLQSENPRFDDKWGPCGCIPIKDDEKGEGWLFFGIASS